MPDGTIKLGKVKLSKNAVLIGGAVAVGIVGYAYYQRSRGGSGSVGGADTGATDPNIDPSTGLPWDESYGGVSYSGLGIYDPATGGTIGYGYGTGTQTVTTVGTNAAWTQAAIAYLEAHGYDGNVVAAALGKVLNGSPVTQSELDIFSAATGVQGNPPQGYPPIHMVGSTGGTTDRVPGSQLPAPTGLKVTNTGTSFITIDWNDIPRNIGYSIYINGVRQRGSSLYSWYTENGLKPNTSYKFTIHGIGVDHKEGPGVSITGKTKAK